MTCGGDATSRVRSVALAVHIASSVGWVGAVARSTLLHSVGGMVVLLVVLVLNVVKPRGITRYGWRKQRQRTARAAP